MYFDTKNYLKNTHNHTAKHILKMICYHYFLKLNSETFQKKNKFTNFFFNYIF